jgi:hypothetical protein
MLGPEICSLVRSTHTKWDVVINLIIDAVLRRKSVAKAPVSEENFILGFPFNSTITIGNLLRVTVFNGRCAESTGSQSSIRSHGKFCGRCG